MVKPVWDLKTKKGWSYVVIETDAKQPCDLVSINSIHINTLRLIIACLLPMAAKSHANPEAWLEEFQTLALNSADYASFAAAGSISPDLMKAAVIGSLEELFSGAKGTLRPAGQAG